MNPSITYGIAFLLSALASMFTYLFVVWSKKSKEYYEELKRIEEEKQELFLRATIEGQEKERKRMAIDLHDDIGPLLSALKLQINSTQFEIDKVDINNTLNETVKNIRNISSRMSPAVLEELGLYEAIQSIVSRFRKSSDIDIQLVWNSKIEDLLGERNTIHIYRIIQESLNNIIKHAHAKNVVLKGEHEEDTIKIAIIDDGIGFDFENYHQNFGLGLNNIKARCKILKADLDIQSKNKSTIISIQINLKNDIYSAN